MGSPYGVTAGFNAQWDATALHLAVRGKRLDCVTALLATKIDVLPITIYNEFTNYANFSMAASLSIVLGLITWAALACARTLSGATTAATA